VPSRQEDQVIEVARRAGIAKSTLSQLESGTGNPSLETLWAICVALDAPFSRLLDPPDPEIQVIRAGEGPTVAAAQADYHSVVGHDPHRAWATLLFLLTATDSLWHTYSHHLAYKSQNATSENAPRLRPDL